VLLFGERLSMMQIGGIGFIAAGVFFLQRAA
jgi:multidrug transporter EmrE-like cation transporter